jgi:hypothetical protein
MAFERVLMIRPDTPRARLELARCYYQLGAYDMAERFFREVLAEDPPEQVRENIEHHLRAITVSRREHFLQGIVSAGVDWDDNVNVAPASDVITIITDLGDLPVRVDRPEGDSITHLTADLRYTYMPYGRPLAWKGSLLGFRRTLHPRKDLDLSLAEVRAGPSLRRGGSPWDIYALASHITLETTATPGPMARERPSMPWSMRTHDRCRPALQERRTTTRRDANDAENTAFVLAPYMGPGNRTASGHRWPWNGKDAGKTPRPTGGQWGRSLMKRVLPLAFTLLAGYLYQGAGTRKSRPCRRETPG